MRFFRSFGQKSKLLRNFEKILKFFDENSLENLNLYFIFIFENLLLKIEPSEITPFFSTNFFRFGGIFPFPPGYALGWRRVIAGLVQTHLLTYIFVILLNFVSDLPIFFEGPLKSTTSTRNVTPVIKENIICYKMKIEIPKFIYKGKMIFYGMKIKIPY